MPKIVYLDTLPAQNGIDILESQSLIEVVKITSNGSYQEAFEELSNAHAYQVSAARDEVPEIFQVDDEFLSKTPNAYAPFSFAIVLMTAESKSLPFSIYSWIR